MKRTRFVALTSLLALSLSACSSGVTAQDPVAGSDQMTTPTVATLVGLWLQTGNEDRLGTVLRFDRDRSFSMDAAGDPWDEPEARGSVRIEGDTLTFESVGSAGCDDGDSWAWRAGMTSEGVLHLDQGRETAGSCRISAGRSWTLIRISPLIHTRFTVPVPSTTEGPAPTLEQLTGIWLRLHSERGTGNIFGFAPDGTFAADLEGDLSVDPAARGTFALDGDTLSFTSRGSRACNEGDDWAWQAATIDDGLLHVVHVEEGLGTCRVANGITWTLVRVSPRSDAAARLQLP